MVAIGPRKLRAGIREAIEDNLNACDDAILRYRTLPWCCIKFRLRTAVLPL